eukprot:NODE_5239_length_1793_cov_12.216687.p1 GENE.NODE_5239_length_1793_cov_12.216687~~NODE_5239_length_1793_cov_12.216687.p1  ORF type:complete len:591 (-),score=144.04 NODE_5239_length_1793_cov_12.216687:20-1792(-)
MGKQERSAFQNIAKERVLRCQLEQQLDERNPTKNILETQSCSTASDTFKVFDGVLDCLPNAARECLTNIANLGITEHWLLNSSEVSFPKPGHLLGAGSFGLVIAGVFHGAVVAVKAPCVSRKSVHIESLGSIASELRILRRVRHPSIVLLHGAMVDPKNGEIALVLEYVGGKILSNFLLGDCAHETRLSILLDICSALRYLHAQVPAIVHGDLKSSNIVVQHSDVEATWMRAKLLDFGLSRVLTRHARPLGGTVPWMAPELLVQNCPPKTSADVFSFGRIIYHVTTGQQPLNTFSNADFINWARKRHAVPPLRWPVSCAFHDEAAALSDDMLHFEPLNRPDIMVVHTKLLTWGSLGVMASVALAAASGLVFNTAVSEARASVSCMRSKIECRAATATPPSRTTGKIQAKMAPVVEEAAAPAIGGIGTGGDRGSGIGGGDNDAFGAGDGSGSGGAIDSGASGGARSALPLFLPAFAATPDLAKDLVMVDALARWNCVVPVRTSTCCMFHALVSQELPDLQERLAQLTCTGFTPHDGWQCPACFVLDSPKPSEGTVICSACGHAEGDSRHTLGEAPLAFGEEPTADDANPSL